MAAYPVIYECSNCSSDFYRSVTYCKDQQAIVLLCTACEKFYYVPDRPDQRRLLSHQYGQYFRKDRLTKLTDLGIGDIFGYEGKFLGKTYHHSLLTWDINHQQGTIRSIELMNDEWEAKIVKRELDFQNMSGSKDLLVFRYMPLDCLPLPETEKRALDMAQPGAWPRRYDAYENNCQHFTGYCKTAMTRSEDAERYRKHDPGDFLKDSYQTSMIMSGFSKTSSKQVSGFSMGLSGRSSGFSHSPSKQFSGLSSGLSGMSSGLPRGAGSSYRTSSADVSEDGWSSDKLRLSMFSSKLISGLVEEFGPSALGWSSQNIGFSLPSI